jgi:Na+-driven multidrug efflux pump
MIIARIIAGWGTTAIAVQKVGSQIESISWLTAGGFQSAMSAFIGQNLGARKLDRVKTGYFVGLAIVSVIGVFATVLLFFFAEPLFAVFVEESETITLGIDYLRILAASQLFMCIEITTAGAFYGLGKPFPPPIVGISFNALRIPMAIGLSATSLGLNGIWWAISISSILKGTVLTAWYIILIRKRVDHLTV